MSPHASPVAHPCFASHLATCWQRLSPPAPPLSRGWARIELGLLCRAPLPPAHCYLLHAPYIFYTSPLHLPPLTLLTGCGALRFCAAGTWKNRLKEGPHTHTQLRSLCCALALMFIPLVPHSAGIYTRKNPQHASHLAPIRASPGHRCLPPLSPSRRMAPLITASCAACTSRATVRQITSRARRKPYFTYNNTQATRDRAYLTASLPRTLIPLRCLAVIASGLARTAVLLTKLLRI